MALDITNRSQTMDAAVDMLKGIHDKISPEERVALTFLLRECSNGLDMWRQRYVELADAADQIFETDLVTEQLRDAPGIAALVPVEELYVLRDAASKRKSYEQST